MGLAPLIGLGALLGLETFREPISNRQNAIRGRNRERSAQRGAGVEELPQGGLLSDVGLGEKVQGSGDPLRREGRGDTRFNEAGAIFYGGGDLSAQNFLTQRYTDDLQAQQSAAAMARQRVSSGPAYQNAQLARDKFNFEKNAIEQNAQNTKEFHAWQVHQGASPYEAEALGNAFTPDAVKQQLSQDILARNTQAQPFRTEGQLSDISKYGPNFDALDAGTKQDIFTLENEIGSTQEVLRFMDESTAVGRAMQPEERAQIMSTYALNSRNYLRNRFEAGAMQEADIKMFEELAGNPDSWTQLTKKQQGRVKSILEDQVGSYDRQLRSLGLNPQDVTPTFQNPQSGGTLEPVGGGDLQSLIDAAREETAKVLGNTDPSKRGSRRRTAPTAGAGLINPSVSNPNPRRRGSN